MNHFSHRFTNLTSLMILLMLTIGTAWLFSFATKTNALVESVFESTVAAQEELADQQSARASSTLLR